MKKILFLLFAFLAACSSSTINQAEVAARAAKAYYTHIQQGKYQAFVDAHFRPDSIPASYREQLVTNAKMFAHQQQTEHQGIQDIRIVSAQADSKNHTANVFLVLAYGDSTNEEIVVPMVKHKGVWYLR